MPSSPSVDVAHDDDQQASEAELLRKIQLQAGRLVEQQRQLVAAIDYARRCEQRLRQLDPSHPLPVSMDHLTQPVERTAQALPTPWTPADVSLTSTTVEAASSPCSHRASPAESRPASSTGHPPTSLRQPTKRAGADRRGEGVRTATVESLRVEKAKLLSVLRVEREASAKFKAEKEREVGVLRRLIDSQSHSKGTGQQDIPLLIQLEEERARSADLQAIAYRPSSVD